MKIANFIPFFSALAWLGAWWWLKQDPNNFLIINALIIIFYLLAAKIVSAKAKEKKWWNIALLPTTTNIVVLNYIIISNWPALIDLLVVALLLLNYIYWRFVFYYYNLPSRYTSFSLDNLSFYVNFLNVFLLGALAYGLRAFLQYNFWLILLGVAMVLTLIIYQGLWVGKVEWSKYRWHGLVYLGVLLEFFGVIGLLPLNHNLLGFLWAAVYYLLLILFNDLINHRLNPKRLRFYMALVAAGWLILLLTANWL